MISITLPTRRLIALVRTLDNLLATTRNPLQVVIASTFSELEEISRYRERMNLVYLIDRNRLGPNAAHAMAFEYVTGDYVLAWVDDHLMVDGWDCEVLKHFDHRSPLLVGVRHKSVQHVGTCFGKYYGYFPMMRRMDVEKVGGWISPDYRKGFGDVDLAMRVWHAGGHCEPSIVQAAIQHEDDMIKLGDLLEGEAQSTPEDMQLFLSRWGEVFGKGWDTSHLRGFNLDVDRP
jgi:GT2 family glycosyltransferase